MDGTYTVDKIEYTVITKTGIAEPVTLDSITKKIAVTEDKTLSFVPSKTSLAATYDEKTGEIKPVEAVSYEGACSAYFVDKDGKKIDTCDSCRLYGVTETAVDESCCKNEKCVSKKIKL